jgi:hypothetical protein
MVRVVSALSDGTTNSVAQSIAADLNVPGFIFSPPEFDERGQGNCTPGVRDR